MIDCAKLLKYTRFAKKNRKFGVMKSVVLKIAVTFAVFTLLMILDRAAFIAVYGAASAAPASRLWGDAMAHGVAMDMSVAGYLTAVPALLVPAAVWCGRRRWPVVAERVWHAVAAVALAAVFTLDLALYGHWGFRLDTTPVFYFTTSPASAMASASWWQLIAGVVAMAAIAAAVYALLRLTAGRIRISVLPRRRVAVTAVGMVLTAALFIPVRGGFTVSTMNMSRAYFSTDTRLNHVAVNPVFSLMYSAAHQGGFDRQFRFFGSDSLALAALPGPEGADVSPVRLSQSRPDVYVVILESFSAHLMPSLGGAPVACGLDSIARDGLSFTRFYANSFRTDRSIPAILSGFPSQPTASIMKYTEKAERLPGLAAEMHRQGGYETAYYYGGDANFTNMLAYLRSTGFGRVVSDRDFPLSERLSKWGAHDHVVFGRVIADARKAAAGGMAPQFTVIQTSSSHEPFEVPFRDPKYADVPQANAFAYTDSCLTDFVRQVGELPRQSLVVMVADHYGAWPRRDSLPDFASRHHVPLVVTGTALVSRPMAVDVAGSQNDIAATLLGLLGMDATAFPFSHDMLDGSAAHFAWISEPDLIGVVSRDGSGCYDISASRPLPGSDPVLTRAAQAWLQLVYTAMGR